MLGKRIGIAFIAEQTAVNILQRLFVIDELWLYTLRDRDRDRDEVLGPLANLP